MCSYCGCEAIGVIGRFMAEHGDLVNLTGDLERACRAGVSDDVERYAAELDSVLLEHTDAEEAGLFSVLRRQDEFAAHVGDLCAEHVALDALLDAVRGGAYQCADAFMHDLRRHIDREENGLFPAAAIGLAGPDWEEVDHLTPAPHEQHHSHPHPGTSTS